MTPEQIHELSKQIAQHGLPPRWGEWVVLILLVIVGAALSAYIGAFYAKRGEIKAINRSLGSLVKQTEALILATGTINSNLGRQDWVEQKKWEIKQQYYWSLLPKLHHYTTGLGHYIATLREFESIKSDTTSDREEVIKRLEANKKKSGDALQTANEHFARIQEAQVFAGVVLSVSIRNHYIVFLDRATSAAGKTGIDFWESIREAALGLETHIQLAATEDLQMQLHDDRKTRIA